MVLNLMFVIHFTKPFLLLGFIIIIMTNFSNDVIISPHSGAYHCGECETCPREDTSPQETLYHLPRHPRQQM